jgi:hypothetical protein
VAGQATRLAPTDKPIIEQMKASGVTSFACHCAGAQCPWRRNSAGRPVDACPGEQRAAARLLRLSNTNVAAVVVHVSQRPQLTILRDLILSARTGASARFFRILLRSPTPPDIFSRRTHKRYMGVAHRPGRLKRRTQLPGWSAPSQSPATSLRRR